MSVVVESFKQPTDEQGYYPRIKAGAEVRLEFTMNVNGETAEPGSKLTFTANDSAIAVVGASSPEGFRFANDPDSGAAVLIVPGSNSKPWSPQRTVAVNIDPSCALNTGYSITVTYYSADGNPGVSSELTFYTTTGNNWDNVSSVSKVALIANNSTQSNGTLFRNNHHRLPFKVNLSFNLKNTGLPGPTNDEIGKAISWINYSDGSAVESVNLAVYLEGDAGYSSAYNLFYDDNTATGEPSSVAYNSYTNSLNAQAFSLSTDSDLNQKPIISFKLAGTKSDGSTFVWAMNNQSSSVHASFTINTVFKKYSFGNSSMTNFVVETKISQTDTTINSSYIHPDRYSLGNDIVRLIIDDDVFKLAKVDGTTGNAQYLQYYSNIDGGKDGGAGYFGGYFMKNVMDHESEYMVVFSPQWTDTGNTIDATGDTIDVYDAYVRQSPWEFLMFKADLWSYDFDYNTTSDDKYPDISAWDQFGNNSTVKIHNFIAIENVSVK